MNAPIRVLIADDHEIVREGLYLLLSEATQEIDVVGQARHGAEAVAIAADLQPDVILMDLIMPDMDGIEATRRLRAAGVGSKVIILTSFVEGDRVRDAIQAGATGYLLKDVLKNDLINAIRSAFEGKPTLHPVVQQYLMHQVTSPAPPSPFAILTEREKDVLRLLATGHSNKEIAVQLALTVGTVKGYVSAILSKLEMADRTQAALYAVSNGLV
ncbi:MAG: response regulator transcription factor [Fibrella sp.]|nr:response regulator transcription factor [Armatimonadota bacterium]